MGAQSEARLKRFIERYKNFEGTTGEGGEGGEGGKEGGKDRRRSGSHLYILLPLPYKVLTRLLITTTLIIHLL